MDKRLRMVYWKGEKYWLGKLLEYPEIMTQGETLEDLEENLKDACRLSEVLLDVLGQRLLLEDVPKDYRTKEIAV